VTGLKIPAVVTPRRVLFLMLAASLLLRLALIQLGGQLYWGDEYRCLDGRTAVREIAAGRYLQVLTRFDAGDHPMFRVVSLIPASVEYLTGVEDTRIAATFLALFSVLNVWLAGRIACRLGAGQWESTLASVLMALSASLTYWARHLMPYDVAMSLGLLAVLVGTNPQADARASVRCGLLAACAFLVYNGYWALAFGAVLVHASRGRGLREFGTRALLTARGFAAVLCILLAYDAALGGGYVSRALAFSRTVIQGSYGEGARLPFEYLWHTEHLLLVAWLAAAGWSFVLIARGGVSAREQVGLLGLAIVYGCLVSSSVVLHVFVVYGRLARQMLPFLCLVAAARLEVLRTAERRGPRVIFAGVMVVLLVQAGLDFRGPLGQVFPREFVQRASRYANCGPQYGSVLAVNADSHHPLPVPVALPPRYVVLEEAPHPREFLPYQYEGTSPAERRLLRHTDIRMRLVLPILENAPKGGRPECAPPRGDAPVTRRTGSHE
jgi:hypothetical protein